MSSTQRRSESPLSKLYLPTLPWLSLLFPLTSLPVAEAERPRGDGRVDNREMLDEWWAKRSGDNKRAAGWECFYITDTTPPSLCFDCPKDAWITGGRQTSLFFGPWRLTGLLSELPLHNTVNHGAAENDHICWVYWSLTALCDDGVVLINRKSFKVHLTVAFRQTLHLMQAPC